MATSDASLAAMFVTHKLDERLHTHLILLSLGWRGVTRNAAITMSASGVYSFTGLGVNPNCFLFYKG